MVRTSLGELGSRKAIGHGAAGSCKRKIVDKQDRTAQRCKTCYNSGPDCRRWWRRDNYNANDERILIYPTARINLDGIGEPSVFSTALIEISHKNG